MQIIWNNPWEDKTKIQELIGEKLHSVSGLEENSDEVVFVTCSGQCLKLYHEQDCCETVLLNDFECDVSDFSGAELLSMEEVSSNQEEDDYGTSTWTFYKIETDRGGVWMRWLGESNGYYSEDVGIAFGRVEDWEAKP